MEGYLATIMMFGGNFAPRNWAFCAGQIIPIVQNTALFSLLGTNYGGDGRVSFGLPDLRGRSVIGVGSNPALSQYDIGQLGGSESETLLSTQMPAHNHTGTFNVLATSNSADSEQPNGNILATPGPEIYATPNTTPTVQYGGGLSAEVLPAGNSQPFSIMQPYLTVNFVICMNGIYPSRP